MAKENIRYASGHQAGVQITYELDFSVKEFSSNIISSDLLSYTSFEVFVRTTDLTGAATNNLTVASGPTKSVNDHADTLGTIALSNTGIGRLAGEFESSHISIQIPSAVTALTSGKMKIIITAKNK